MSGSGHLHAALGLARPRALAALVRAFRDVDLAEDLFQDACERALKSWPERGVPDDPTAWLIRAGYNAGLDLKRRERRIAHDDPADALDGVSAETDQEQAVAAAMDDAVFRDDILRLMFMCCHDELQPTDQLALALKVVAGLSVAEIARALLVSPDAMEQRLTRAKKRAAGVARALDTPSRQARAARLAAVSRMVYLLFNEGYSARGGEAPIRLSLCDEAIRLGRLLLDLFPAQVEQMGLLALMLLQHSRHRARVDSEGNLVPLEEQDRGLWRRDLIVEGTGLVQKALRHGRPGPLQIQAAIAAVHCAAETAEATDWAEIAALYAALDVVAPSPVVTLNRAVAVGRVEGPEAALAMMAPLEPALRTYLPFHAARAGLLQEAGDAEGARRAFADALGCDPNPAEAAFLDAQVAALSKNLSSGVGSGGGGSS